MNSDFIGRAVLTGLAGSGEKGRMEKHQRMLSYAPIRSSEVAQCPASSRCKPALGMVTSDIRMYIADWGNERLTEA